MNFDCDCYSDISAHAREVFSNSFDFKRKKKLPSPGYEEEEENFYINALNRMAQEKAQDCKKLFANLRQFQKKGPETSQLKILSLPVLPYFPSIPRHPCMRCIHSIPWKDINRLGNVEISFDCEEDDELDLDINNHGNIPVSVECGPMDDEDDLSNDTNSNPVSQISMKRKQNDVREGSDIKIIKIPSIEY